MTNLTMHSKTAHHDEPGSIWYLLPAFWTAIAVAGLMLLSFGSPMPQESAAAPLVSATPFADTEFGVPSASSVFSARTWEVSEHVEQF
jgi:hypothetical protein